jgi:O-antigen/teichoic acid export membrane protein
MNSRFKKPLKIWPQRGIFALLDQGLISGSNFAIAVLLARWLAPRSYGAYALAFEVFLFLSIVYAGLVLEPMSVFGASIYKDAFQNYLGVLLRIHCAFSFAIVGFVFAAAGVMHALNLGGSLPTALIGVGIATPCLLLFWLARRGFYVKLLPKKAAVGACAYSAVLLTGFAAMYKLHAASSLSAFLVMAAGAVIAGPLMLRWLRTHTTPARSTRLATKEVLLQHWNYGRWALASSVVIWLSAAIYYPLMGSYFSLAETGAFKALMNLASPVGQVFVAFSLLSLPYASSAHHDRGAAASGRLAHQLTAFYAGGTALYWVALFLVRGPLVQHLYAGHYREIVPLVPLLALGSIARIAATSQAIVLRSMRVPSQVFVAYGAACAVAILAGIPATRWLGLRGALSTWVLSSATAYVGALLMVRRLSRRSAKPEVTSGQIVTLDDAALNPR